MYCIITCIAYVFTSVFTQVKLAQEKPKTTFPRNNLWDGKTSFKVNIGYIARTKSRRWSF